MVAFAWLEYRAAYRGNFEPKEGLLGRHPGAKRAFPRVNFPWWGEKKRERRSVDQVPQRGAGYRADPRNAAHLGRVVEIRRPPFGMGYSSPRRVRALDY